MKPVTQQLLKPLSGFSAKTLIPDGGPQISDFEIRFAKDLGVLRMEEVTFEDKVDPKTLVLLDEGGISEYTIYTHKPTGKLMVPMMVYQLIYRCQASMYWPEGMPNQFTRHDEH